MTTRQKRKPVRPGFLCWAVEKIYRLNYRVADCSEDVPTGFLTMNYFNEYPFDKYGKY